MITCPSCNHQNPEGAVNCEVCYTELPKMIHCPHCNASILSNAVFCGSCGSSLQPLSPDLSENDNKKTVSSEPVVKQQPQIEKNTVKEDDLDLSMVSSEDDLLEEEVEINLSPEEVHIPKTWASATVLQTAKTAKLVHIQTSTTVTIPNKLEVINIGKPNTQLLPDVDVSGFPNSEIVSRIHARLIKENDCYYIEDLGSSNGTYINHLPLLQGDRQELKMGDQISLGKEDKVTFLFQYN